MITTLFTRPKLNPDQQIHYCRFYMRNFFKKSVHRQTKPEQFGTIFEHEEK